MLWQKKIKKIVFNYQNQNGLDEAENVYTDPTVVSEADIDRLQANGAKVNLYISIGEYEEGYRSSHRQFSGDPVVLAENPKWPGNYKVKFWEPEWQEMTLKDAKAIAEMGADGIYLDIVDGYQNPGVQQAYADYLKEQNGGIAVYPDPTGDWEADKELRLAVSKEMKAFVIKISEAAKEINPDIQVIPQNAYLLLAVGEDTGVPDAKYIGAIDGLGLEDFFYHPKDYDFSSGVDQENQWVQYQKPYVQMVLDAGKPVTNINYSFAEEARGESIKKSLENGIIPYAAHSDRALDGNDPKEVNERIKREWDARDQTGSLNLRLDVVREAPDMESAALSLPMESASKNISIG